MLGRREEDKGKQQFGEGEKKGMRLHEEEEKNRMWRFGRKRRRTREKENVDDFIFDLSILDLGIDGNMLMTMVLLVLPC